MNETRTDQDDTGAGTGAGPEPGPGGPDDAGFGFGEGHAGSDPGAPGASGPDGSDDGGAGAAPGDERLTELGQRIESVRSGAADAVPGVEEPEETFVDSGSDEAGDEDDQTIAPG